MRIAFLALISAAAVLAAPWQSPPQDNSIEARNGVTRIVKVFPQNIAPVEFYANIGDNVMFKFGDGFNSVVQGEYETPCYSTGKGFASGSIYNNQKGLYHANAFVIQIKDTEPIWYYNGEVDKCHIFDNVAVINPPRDGSKTINDYMKRASLANSYDNFEMKGGVIVTLSSEAREKVQDWERIGG
ncbi:hypothetical protein CFIMG_006421RA [Ceratocystis fimbriata CBS 114723]|uniref:Uncharacterized protein n=1 Tax=Ceratocystis fimbriata CBS 114723 TaxID=1035309 RepID=A0A2C5WKQ0_9PEZI|nr:hypothetical protein CFIMG_006421RA [Ceratocystis fimbriata CBS 114723]